MKQNLLSNKFIHFILFFIVLGNSFSGSGVGDEKRSHDDYVV